MTTSHNPALYEEPRNKAMTVVPPIPRESLLNWLESIGRFRSNEVDEFKDSKVSEILSEDLDDILESELYVSDNEEDEEEGD